MLGPIKGVIPTPDIAKIFYMSPDIEGKKSSTPDIQNLPRYLTPNFYWKRCNSEEDEIHK